MLCCCVAVNVLIFDFDFDLLLFLLPSPLSLGKTRKKSERFDSRILFPILCMGVRGEWL